MHQKGSPSDARSAYPFSCAYPQPRAGASEPNRAELAGAACRLRDARPARHPPDQRQRPGRIPGRFEREVDPDGRLDPEERARRAEQARRAYFARLALAATKARRAKRKLRQGGDAP